MKATLQALLLCLALAARLGAQDVQATVVSVSGKTQFSDASGPMRPLKMGAALAPGTRIVTDARGLAILLLADGSKLSLGPNTDVTLSEMTQEGEAFGGVFKLLKGLIRASVRKLAQGSKFEVESTHGVAAVKGTEFECEAGDEGMEVRCLEGLVWLSNLKREQAVEIRERMKAGCAHDAPGKPVEMKKEELENFGRWAASALPKNTRRDAEHAAFWASLRPDQKLQAVGALREALGESWDEITSLKAEERQERWRERLRDADERKLAGDEAQIDFALRKSMLDLKGRRVRFSEFLLRPAADQVQFLNYSKRDDRTDLVSAVNTYNKNLPANLGEARDINQKVWFQVAAPEWWVTSSTIVFANSGNDSFAGASWYFDPVRVTGLCGCSHWELPVQKVELAMNLPDIAQPVVAGNLTGTLLERYDRFATLGVIPLAGTTSSIGTNSLATGQAASAALAQASDLRWNGGIGFVSAGNILNVAPTVRALSMDELGVGAGDLAQGERRTYSDGTFIDIRSSAIDENGRVQNLPDLLSQGLFNAYLNLSFRTYQEVNISSNKFTGLGDIDIVSQMMWWYTITKRSDTL
jgi:hypothetical protein